MAADTHTQSFWEHLDVLRTAIVKIVAVAVVFGIAAFFFKEELFAVVLAPKDDGFVTYRLLDSMATWVGRTVFRAAYQYGAGTTVHHSHEDRFVCRSAVRLALYSLPTIPVRFSRTL